MKIFSNERLNTFVNRFSPRDVARSLWYRVMGDEPEQWRTSLRWFAAFVHWVVLSTFANTLVTYQVALIAGFWIPAFAVLLPMSAIALVRVPRDRYDWWARTVRLTRAAFASVDWAAAGLLLGAWMLILRKMGIATAPVLLVGWLATFLVDPEPIKRIPARGRKQDWRARLQPRLPARWRLVRRYARRLPTSLQHATRTES